MSGLFSFNFREKNIFLYERVANIMRDKLDIK